MVVKQIKSEPYNMENGNVTAVKLIIFYEGDNPAPPKDEIIEINPVPFKDLGQVVGALAEHIRARAELEELKEHYDTLKETCRRTHKEAEAILKRPSIEETAERLRQEMEASLREQEERKKQAELLKLKEAPIPKETPEKPIVQSEEKPAHEEKKEEEKVTVQQPEPVELTPRQEAERIYDKVYNEIKGKVVEEEDIIAAVLKAGAHPDRLLPITKEIEKLLKEKGAIPSPKETIKRFLGRGKKKKDKAETQ